MMIGKQQSRSRRGLSYRKWQFFAVTSIALFVLQIFYTMAAAQNSHLINKSVETLDKVNKEALKQLIDIPRDGQIHIEGKGSQRGEEIKVKIERYQVAPIQERSIQLDGKKTVTRSADKEIQDEQ